MAKPRANAISRLLANGGFKRVDAHNPSGFHVYQEGDTCRVFARRHDLEAMQARLIGCGYKLTHLVQSDPNGPAYILVEG